MRVAARHEDILAAMDKRLVKEAVDAERSRLRELGQRPAGTAANPMTLWDQPTARRTDPETSHLAAEDAKAHLSRHRRWALDALREAGDRGLTDFELADITGVAQTSIGVRRKELVRAGYVEATEQRRPAPSGSAAIVWRAK